MDPKFTELLPWYANGTLSASERARVEEALRDDPEAAQELAWLANLQQRIQADEPTVSDDIGLARTLARIRADTRPAAAAAAAQSHPPAASRAQSARRTESGLGERVRQWFSQLGMTPAFAMAALMVIVQTGVIFNMSNEDRDYAQVRSAPATASASGELLRVSFKPDARESDIRMLLVGVQGNIESGPGQLGDYYVRVPAPSAKAIEQLRGSVIIDAVQPVDGVPQRGN